MSWHGKLFGGAFGFLLTRGLLGTILGVYIGHQFDKGFQGRNEPPLSPGDQQRVQMAFFTATFSIMGHIAKADGKVSREEIILAETVMRNLGLSADQQRAAIKLFNEGKNSDFALDATLNHLKEECHRQTSLIRMFLEIQLQAAFADGSLDPAEDRLLLHICGRLQISQLEYEKFKAIFQAQQRFNDYTHEGRYTANSAKKPKIDDAYAVLGVKATDKDSEIKKSYRRLISQNHPDKLVSKGLPEEMMKLATEKTQKIRKAYELICEHRNIK